MLGFMALPSGTTMHFKLKPLQPSTSFCKLSYFKILWKQRSDYREDPILQLINKDLLIEKHFLFLSFFYNKKIGKWRHFEILVYSNSLYLIAFLYIYKLFEKP